MIEHDFLTQIFASTDDAPRLVYADWLEEQGKLERAQLIRAQCELAGLPAWHPRAVLAAWEVEALVAQHGDRWRAELPALDGIEWTEFERGFVSTVRIRDTRALFKHAAAIAAVAPVSRVELPALAETVPYEPVAWLRTVRLTNQGEYGFHPERSILTAAPAPEIANLGHYEDVAWANRVRTAPRGLDSRQPHRQRCSPRFVQPSRWLAAGSSPRSRSSSTTTAILRRPDVGAEGARRIAGAGSRPRGPEPDASASRPHDRAVAARCPRAPARAGDARSMIRAASRRRAAHRSCGSGSATTSSATPGPA